MAGMMTDADWAAYRQQAGNQTQALNSIAGVTNPATLTPGNIAGNNDVLYGRTQPNRMPNAAAQDYLGAFRVATGRAATQQEINAIATAVGQGMSIDDAIRNLTAAADQSTKNAPGFGAGMMGASNVFAPPMAGSPFSAGLMAGAR